LKQNGIEAAVLKQERCRVPSYKKIHEVAEKSPQQQLKVTQQ
jgi:hypothetical protein